MKTFSSWYVEIKSLETRMFTSKVVIINVVIQIELTCKLEVECYLMLIRLDYESVRCFEMIELEQTVRS